MVTNRDKIVAGWCERKTMRSALNGTGSKAKFLKNFNEKKYQSLKPGFDLQQIPRPRHKNKAIMCLSSHPSHKSLCFGSKLVVVVVEIGLTLKALFSTPREVFG